MTSNLQLKTPGFVLSNAQALAVCSQAAYCVVNISCPQTDTEVFITEYDDCCVIAFRGTSDIRQWITDAEFIFEHTPWGRVHSGFWKAIYSVIDLIKQRLVLPKPIFVTGHSLGGALACHCAYLLQLENFPIHSVYTFGQPRIGNAEFMSNFDKILMHKTWRVVNQNDIIPRSPSVLAGYRHGGQLAFINSGGQLQINPPLFGVVMSDLIGFYGGFRKLEEVLITDHFIGSYISALKIV